jgi:hypothetical protein
MLGIGSYYETQGQLGRIDPGIDVSHYGAPYQGMLGLGMGTLYAAAGLGWTPGAGQTPADDPRMVRQYGKVRQTYRVRNIGGKSAETATAILEAARTTYAGLQVRKASGNDFSNGWGPGGRVGVDITVPVATRLGELKQKGQSLFLRNVISGVNPGAALYDAKTGVSASDIQTAPGEPAAPDTPVDPSAPTPPPGNGGNFLTQTFGGVPVWAIGSLAVVGVGGIIFAMTRKKKVAANRRRRARRRRR